jgi:CheY-like chemotaxis protein
MSSDDGERNRPPFGPGVSPLDALFDRLPVASFATTTNGFILRANDEAALLLNVPREFCVGKPLIGFVPRSNCAAFRALKAAATSTASIERAETRIRPRHGRPIVTVSASVRRVAQHLLWTFQPAIAASAVAAGARSVLYVEDDVDIREMVEELLVAEGFTVRTAATLEDARVAFDRAAFDVVMTNYQLPDGDGTSFLESLDDAKARETRFVMITGHPKARRMTGVPCWMKPIDPSTVASKVRELLAERRPA